MTINAAAKAVSLVPQASGILNSAFPAGDQPVEAWQLAEGHYIPRKFDMTLSHPRPMAETPTWSRYRNAYPGILYEAPINVQGGSYPFRYEVSGPPGMTIGGVMVPSGDVLVPPATYGILTWTNPTVGTHAVTVTVYDQEYGRGVDPSTPVSVTFNLVVGTAGWLFIDPVNGNDSTGTGLIGAPFQTLFKLHGGLSTTNTYAGQRVYLRAGTNLLYGMTDASNNYRLNANTVPTVYLGYPGEAVVLEHFEGWFVHNTNHIFLSGFTQQYGSGYAPGGVPTYMNAVLGGMANCFNAFKVAYTNWVGSPSNTGAGNSAIFYTSGANRNYFCLSHNECYGTFGVFLAAYQIYYSVIERNRFHDGSVSTGDGADRKIIFLKDEPNFTSLRHNEAWENLTWPGAFDGAFGIYAQDGARSTEVCYNRVKAPYNSSGRGGAMYDFGANADSGLVENLYAYRNTVSDYWEWEGNNMTNFADGEQVYENNVLNTGVMPSSSNPNRLVKINNIDGQVYLDAQMKLTGAARTQYLGTHGAEIV